MKSTEQFKNIIKEYLDDVASKDPLFAETLKKENKNLDDCITYILNQVKQSGINGFGDDEIFGMAIHYYDEDNIKVGARIECQIITNKRVELSDDEKAEAQKEAMNQEIESERKRIQQEKTKKAEKKAAKVEESQMSLF